MRHVLRVLVLCIAATGPAAYAQSVVLALCEITLTTGDVLPRVVAISRPLPSGEVTTDGFYIVRTRKKNGEETKLPYLWSKELEWVEPHTGRRQFITDGLFGEFQGVYVYETYYLRDISGRDRPVQEERETVEDEDGRRILAREQVFRARYEMLEYVPVYPDVLAALHGECYSPSPDPPAAEIRIPLVDITRFTLIHHPSAERLDETQAAVRTWSDSAMDEISEYWPTWFHQIVADDSAAEWEFRTWALAP